MKSSRVVRRCIAAGVLLVATGCAGDRYEYYESIVTAVEDQPEAEATSLLGRRLYAQSGGEGFTKRQADLAAALRDLKDRPPDPAKIVWVGRRLGYLWRMNDAVAVYTGGIRRNPDYAPLYRHRGHRFISLRRFDRAEADLARAARLIEGRPDEIEPDGMPNTRNIPLSTTAFNVYYHLALRRLGREEDAASILEPIRAEMDIIENHAYHELLLMLVLPQNPWVDELRLCPRPRGFLRHGSGTPRAGGAGGCGNPGESPAIES